MKHQNNKESDGQVIFIIDNCVEDIFLNFIGLVIFFILCFFIMLKFVEFKIALFINITLFALLFYVIISKLSRLLCYSNFVIVQNFLQRDKFEKFYWNEIFINKFTPPAATLTTELIQLKKVKDGIVIFQFSKQKEIKYYRMVKKLRTTFLDNNKLYDVNN